MPNQPPNTAQAVARLVRHEVGDLLQSVYATVSVLLDRLAPGAAPERQLLDNLKHRAELCRFEIDAVVDLVCPAAAVEQRVEIDRLVASSVAQVVSRYPNIAFETPPSPALAIRADGRLVAGAITFLLLALCQHARKKVVVRIERHGDLARVVVHRDGPAAGAEDQRWIEEPFASTRQSMLGLALAVAGRAFAPGGGRVAIANQAGGVEVLLESPISPA